MKVFYHSADLDGQCSAAIVKYKYPDAELIPINYGDEFPWDIIEEDEQVFMVDYSLKEMSDMKRLDKLTHFVWIDHHRTAIEAAKETNFTPQGSRDENFAACELTWKFLFIDEVPKAVHFLSLYDIWQHNDDLQILSLQYGMRLYDSDPRNEIVMLRYEQLFKNHEPMINQIISEGKTILQYIHSNSTTLCELLCYEFEFEGYRCIAANVSMVNSNFFHSVYHTKYHDIMITYYNKNGKHWYVSLYTTKTDTINVGYIAKKFGGGGHPGAAGFTTRELPFPLFKTE